MALLESVDSERRVTATPRAPSQRRRPGGISRNTVFDLAGSAVAGVSVSMLLFGRLATLSGPFGFFVVAYAVFLVVYALLVSLRDDGPAVRNAVMTAVLTSAACLAFGALALVVGFTVWKARAALFHSNFYTQDLSKAGPLASLKVGGVAHALIGTLWMIGIALVLSVPLGLVCAVYLDQTRSRPARLVRTIVNAMTALPTILAGLFIYASWILTFGFQQSGLAAALALSIMMMPYMVRTSDLVLRLVPNSLREASGALGAPRWRTVWHVVLPTARSGLATAVILAIARAIGEASPVLLTAGYTTYLNADPIHGPMVSLPLSALKLVASGVPVYASRGYACAALLLFVILGLFVLTRIIGGFGPGHLTSRQQRRIARASARVAARFSYARPSDVSGGTA